jgi:hypothetical protein
VASLIQGSKERPIESILLSDITIQSVSEGTKAMVDSPVPERPGDPIELLNCSGMYCRHIQDLEMHNVRFSKLEADVRPVIICEKIDHLHMDNVRCLNDPSPQTVLLRDINILKRHPLTVD